MQFTESLGKGQSHQACLWSLNNGGFSAAAGSQSKALLIQILPSEINSPETFQYATLAAPTIEREPLPCAQTIVHSQGDLT
jgi:hypothetical protein